MASIRWSALYLCQNSIMYCNGLTCKRAPVWPDSRRLCHL